MTAAAVAVPSIALPAPATAVPAALIVQVFWVPAARPSRPIPGSHPDFDLVSVPVPDWSALVESLAKGAMINAELLLTVWGEERGTRCVTRRLPILFGADSVLRMQPCLWTVVG
jgi:hypothetical protein